MPAQSHSREEELAKLLPLVGMKVVAIQASDDPNESPAIILEADGELFSEIVELFKFHRFDGPNVQTFYGVEELASAHHAPPQ